jgi:hypothetical protein
MQYLDKPFDLIYILIALSFHYIVAYSFFLDSLLLNFIAITGLGLVYSNVSLWQKDGGVSVR